MLWEQGVGGSNPLTPTRQEPHLTDIKPFFIEGLLFSHIDSNIVIYYQKVDTLLVDTPPPKGFKQEPRISGFFCLWDCG